MIKLHLGCGNIYLPGYIHIDVIKYEHVDYLSPVEDLHMFEDNMVDLIYNCHVLEHFERTKFKKVLIEWHRVLKSKGILRTAVPDFEAVCRVYRKNKNIDEIEGPVMGGQTYLYNFHNTIFDFNKLKKALTECGFVNVHRYDWWKVGHSDIDDYSKAYLPHMDKKGTLMSLNVEAEKGKGMK